MNSKFVNRFLVGALVASTTMLSGVLPARASSSQCSFGLYAVSGCWTNTVQANRTSHHVHIAVSRHVTYEVVDVANGVVVAKGTTGWGGVDRTITGLYSSYRLHIWNGVTATLTGGWGEIHNE